MDKQEVIKLIKKMSDENDREQKMFTAKNGEFDSFAAYLRGCRDARNHTITLIEIYL